MATYHIPASDMGEGYTEEEMTSYEDYIREEMREAGIDSDDEVYVTEAPTNFIPLWREDIRDAVERAWDKWINSPHNEMEAPV